MNYDEKWMNLAIEQAIKAQDEDEVPVGAVLVKDGLLIQKLITSLYQQMMLPLTLKYRY